MMKKHYYTAFWAVLCLVVGLFTFVQITPIPYQVTLVKELGDEKVLQSLVIEGHVTNERLMDYYNFRIKDGRTGILESPHTWHLSNTMQAHYEKTLQQFPIWNRPDIRAASGVALPDGRELWVKEEHTHEQGFRYIVYLIDKQKRTYQRQELQLSDTPIHISNILQLVVNGNQVDMLISKDDAYKAGNREDTMRVSWYRIDVSNLTTKHIKDLMLSALNPRLDSIEFVDQPERRFVFVSQNTAGKEVVKVIDPVTEKEQEISFPVKGDEQSYVQAEIESDIIYLFYVDGRNHRITLSYDEAQRQFIKITDAPAEGIVLNGYVYQINWHDEKVPRIEVVELATGKMVYRGTLTVDGPEGTEMLIYSFTTN